jgi:hypothetical protein
LANEKETKGIENIKDLRGGGGGGDLVSERKRISRLFSRMSILKDQIAVGLERPL